MDCSLKEGEFTIDYVLMLFGWYYSTKKGQYPELTVLCTH
jgi:hypothetical protein